MKHRLLSGMSLFLFLYLTTSLALAVTNDTVTIGGVITNSNGHGVPGATVQLVDNLSCSTTTD